MNLKPFVLVFLVWVLIDLGFYFWVGSPFGRPDYNDLSFHLAKARDPLSNSYAPLFHVLVFVVGLLIPIPISFIIVSSAVVFLFIPYSVMRLSWEIYRDEQLVMISGVLSVFGSSSLILFIHNATYPQALLLGFFVLGLSYMAQSLNGRLGFLEALLIFPLAVASHNTGLWLYGLSFVIYLTLGGLGFVLIFLPYLFVVWPRELGFHIFGGRRLLEVVFLWLNPFMIYLALEGRQTFNTSSKTVRLLDYSILVCVLFAWVDPYWRPLLMVSPLLSVYAAKGLMRITRPRPILGILFVVWFLHFLYVFIGVLGLYLGTTF